MWYQLDEGILLLLNIEVMNKFVFLIKQITAGKSILRSYLDYSLLSIELRGKTIDIGGGSGSGYVSFVKRSSDVVFETFDLKAGQQVDFEKDNLPALDNSYDTVLFLNVMEHIFNYQHIANEVLRITKKDGQLIGYVPFLMWYHPDHSDYFRYTHEAIEKIFYSAGAKQVKVLPNFSGPFVAGLQMIVCSMPRLFRPVAFSMVYLLDYIFFKIKKMSLSQSNYILGYVFLINK